MPTISIQSHPPQDQNGIAHGSPSDAMHTLGPRVPVHIALSQRHAQVCAERGTPPPPTVSGLALIDTGASMSCIDINAAEEAELPIVGEAQMSSTTTAQGGVTVPVYEAQMVIPINNVFVFDLQQALGASLHDQGIAALIGRDILKAGVFVFNGSAGSCSLSI